MMSTNHNVLDRGDPFADDPRDDPPPRRLG